MSGGCVHVSIKLDILHPDYLCDLVNKTPELEIRGHKNVFGESVTKGSILLDALDFQRNKIKNLLNETLKEKLSTSNKGLLSATQKDLDAIEKKRKIARSVFDEMLQYGKRLLECIRILKDVNDELQNVSSLRCNSVINGMFKDIPSLFKLHEHLTESFDSCETEDIELPSAFTSDKEMQILNIYKSFLCRYAVNFKAFSEMYSTNEELQNICKGIVAKSQYQEQRIQNVPGMFYGVSTALPRYKDLIYRLKGTMLPSDPEYTNVTKAWNFIKDLLDRSEQEIILQEKMLNAREALGKLDGLRVKYTQIPLLHLEGPAKKLPRRSIHRRLLDRYLFLFSEYLVMTESPNAVGRYQVKSEIGLAGMTLCEVKDDEEINVEHCFRIKAKELCVEVAFSNDDEKQLWWRELQQAIDFECNKPNSNCFNDKKSLMSANSLGEVAAQWVKDESSTMCTNCCTEFTTLNRRHHCRACGKLFCGSCSAYKAPLESCGGKYERVCVVDYYLLNKNFKPPKPKIMEAILRRVDKQQPPQPLRTGFLMWSHFNNSWSTKSPIRLPKSSVQYRSVDTSFEIRKELLRDIGPFNSSSKFTCKNSSTDPVDNHHDSNTQSTSNSLPHINNRSFESPINIESTNHKSSSACLSRLFCVLQTDTSFEFYAARADTRAVDKITVIGLRLFYLDDNFNDTFSTHSDDLSTIQQPTLHTKAQSFDSSSRVDNDFPENTIGSFRWKYSRLYKQGNPIYRNFKPPPRDRNIFDHEFSSETSSLSDVTSLSKSYIKPSSLNTLEADRLSNRSTQSCRERSSKENHKDSSCNFSGDQSNDDDGIVTNSEILKHVETISPEILGLLRNNLGFLLLPLNTDRPAHYFEAATVEIRTQWINSIRRVCIDFMSSPPSR
ncbi:unnamed protein product [Schistosoma spindalis]|nr:unnamed protein product [Schistosoma spindale]